MLLVLVTRLCLALTCRSCWLSMYVRSYYLQKCSTEFNTSAHVRLFFFFFQAEDGIRDHCVTGVQTWCSSDLNFSVGQDSIPLGSPTPQVTRYFYNLIGWVDSTKTPAGRMQTFWRDALGNPIIEHTGNGTRSEERRVGKEGRSRWSPYH